MLKLQPIEYYDDEGKPGPGDYVLDENELTVGAIGFLASDINRTLLRARTVAKGELLQALTLSCMPMNFRSQRGSLSTLSSSAFGIGSPVW